MNEWITYDGTNPPTDTSRWLQVHYKNGREAVWASGTWGTEEFCGYADGAMMDIVACRYLDLDSYLPPEPEMPEEIWAWRTAAGELAAKDERTIGHGIPYVKKRIDAPADTESVVVSIKALRMLRRLLDDAAGTSELVATPEYLDYIITSATPQEAKPKQTEGINMWVGTGRPEAKPVYLCPVCGEEMWAESGGAICCHAIDHFIRITEAQARKLCKEG